MKKGILQFARAVGVASLLIGFAGFCTLGVTALGWPENLGDIAIRAGGAFGICIAGLLAVKCIYVLLEE